MLTVGNRVGYARAFLKSIGGDYATAQRRGTVVGEPYELVRGMEVVSILWDESGAASIVLTANVAKLGTVKFID